MVKQNIQLPKHLIFSGTGSKILNIITSDNKILATLSKKIFEEVFKQEFDSEGLTVETEKTMPKELTCKGGLMSNASDLAFDIQSIKCTLTCLEKQGIDKLTYDQLIDETKDKIIEHVKKFNTFIIKLNSQYSFSDFFNASEKSLEIFKLEINKHLRDYLEEGLEFNKKLDEGSSDDREIEETLFFHPLIGTINNLSEQLSSLNDVNN
jgi:hypothetical protein